jgi:hypothetical protein
MSSFGSGFVPVSISAGSVDVSEFSVFSTLQPSPVMKNLAQDSVPVKKNGCHIPPDMEYCLISCCQLPLIAPDNRPRAVPRQQGL